MQLKCQNCGAPLTYSNGLYLCEYCGSQVANEELPQIQLEIDNSKRTVKHENSD